MAQKLAKRLEELGADVYLTRTPSDYWRPAYNSVDDNKARAIYANEVQADVLLSLHCDWHHRKKVHGVTTIYANRTSAHLARTLHKHMVRDLKRRDRKVVKDTFTILDHAEMPAVIIETGFMSHKQESKLLITPTYQTKVAHTLSKGLVRYFR